MPEFIENLVSPLISSVEPEFNEVEPTATANVVEETEDVETLSE